MMFQQKSMAASAFLVLLIFALDITNIRSSMVDVAVDTATNLSDYVMNESFTTYTVDMTARSKPTVHTTAATTTTDNTTAAQEQEQDVVVTVHLLTALFATLATVSTALFTYFAIFAATHFNAVKTGLENTVGYWRTLFHYWMGGTYESCPHFKDSVDARVHLRSLALINEMWDQPHYRNGTFGVDMAKNLRNVAVPGTGLPLSTLCFSSTFFKLVLLVVYPVTALAAAIIRRKPDATADDVSQSFVDHLVRPTDWFSLWRLNCRLASYHALKTKDDGYRAEDKWTFITESLKNNVPVSPIMEIPNIVCKDRNEEGGMGIHFFKNALSGGDWIIQKSIKNSEFLQTMLPDNAPLSTIRIVTGSSMSFADAAEAKPVKAFSCVFRAGRAGAATDHDAILFDVDLKSGLIQEGSINKEWYKLGTENVNPYGRPDISVFTEHPDCGKKVTGITIPDIASLEAICIDAHKKSCANVPLCGWDVALTTEGVCLLEVNLSCNFFQATVDYPEYFKFVDQQFKYLEGLESVPAKTTTTTKQVEPEVIKAVVAAPAPTVQPEVIKAAPITAPTTTTTANFNYNKLSVFGASPSTFRVKAAEPAVVEISRAAMMHLC